MKEILTKAIQKAIEGGYKSNHPADGDYNHGALESTDSTGHVKWQDGYTEYYPSLIFNHDFAKALWGDKKIDDTKSCFDAGIRKGDLRVYQYHLILMVLADDPVKYLGENI